jgi:protein transport protein SEC24
MEYDQQGQQPQGKKKRAYAQQAYEFGANASQQQAQGSAPIMGGVGAQQMGIGAQQMPQNPQDHLANQFGQMNLQQPQQPQQQQQSYQPYTQQPQQPIPQQMQQPVQQQQQQQMPGMGMANQNQLLPSDLMSQPFMVQELENPPPPINLPPNVSSKHYMSIDVLSILNRRVSLLLLMQIATPNMFDRR